MKKLFLLSLAVFATPLLSDAANISLTNNDAFGTSSFNTKGNWNSSTAPVAGNDYFTGPTFRLRTPADGNSYTFAGDSLTVDLHTASGDPLNGGFMYKGTGTNGVITVNNLILAGGRIHQQNGVTDLFRLAGNINVTADSSIHAKQGDINVTAVISGTGGLTIPITDAPGETFRRDVRLLANNSAYTGKMNVLGKLAIVAEEGLGGNPAVFTPDQLTLDGGWLRITNSVVINDSNRGITLNGLGGTLDLINPDTNTIASLTIATPITGGGALTKAGGGTLTLSGNNDFSGGVTLQTSVAGSRLNINSATALGSGMFTIGAGATPATLDNTSGSAVTLTPNNSQTWNNGVTFLGSSSLNMGSGTVVLFANIIATVSNNNLTIGPVFDDGLSRTLTKRGPGTFTINGGAGYFGNTTVEEGVLALAGAGTLSSPTITIFSNATLNAVAAGGLTLNFGQTLRGSGTVVGNVSDGAGSTAINPGMSAGTLTIDGNLALQGGTTLNFELSSSTTVGGGVNDLIVVTGQLNISGSTTLNVLGNTGTGNYVLFQYGSFAGSLANLTIPAGYSLTNNTATKTIELISTHVPTSLTWRGDGLNNIWDLATTPNWVQSGSPEVFYNGDSVTFDNSGSNTPAITLTGDMSPAAVTVNSSKNYTFTGGGIATGSLTKDGSGTLTLDNTNTYSGGTTINGGTLQLGDPFGPRFGTAGTLGTGPITNHANLLFNRTDNMTIAGAVHGSGTVSNVSQSGTITLSGPISGSTVTMSGFGTMVLAGSNSHSGVTRVTSGVLAVRNANALGSDTAGTVVESGGQVYIDQNISFTNNESLALSGFGPLGNGALRKGGGGATTWAGPVTLAFDAAIHLDGGATLNLTNASGLVGPNVNLTLSGDGGSQGFVAGAINIGSGMLTKSGAGTWTVAATNSYTGKTFLNGGLLAIPAPTALGPAPGVPTSDFVNFNGGGLAVTNDQVFSDPNRGFMVGSAGILSVGSGATLTVSNILSGTGSLTKWLPGTLLLTGANPFSGTLFLDGNSATANDGITRIASPNAIANVPATPGTATIIQRNNNSGFSTLQLDGSAGSINLPQEFALSCRNNDVPNIQNIAGNNTISGDIQLFIGGNRVIFQSDAGLLTLSGANQYLGTLIGGRTYTFTGAGNILVSGPILNSGNGAPISLAKFGTGQLTLSAANTYGNTTTVNEGLLLVTGSISSTGGVFVVGGTLGGNGTINDNVTVQSGGTLAPGTSIGNLTINGNLTMGGNLAWEVNKSLAPSNDTVTVSGSVANTGAGTLSVSNAGPALAVGDQFTIFNQPVTGGDMLAVVGAGVTWSNRLAIDGSIVVASTVASYPTNLTFSRSGSTLTISWPSTHQGWILQTQTNALNVGLQSSTNAWFDVPGSGSVTSTNITINPADPTVFFRLRRP